MPLTPIPDLPDSVVGLTASGKITEQDYDEVLIPAVDAVLEHHDRLRILYVLGDDFESYSGGAMWEDAKLGGDHLTKFERCAVVTDHAAMRHAIELFGYLIPGKVKTYPLSDLDTAKGWITS